MQVEIKVDKQYAIMAMIAVLLSWTLHELAHWVCGRFLGYDMGMTLNRSFPLNQVYYKDYDFQLISAAGPFFTLLEAFFIFLLMSVKKRKSLYPFLFTCFYMRFFAAIISFHNPNDEARVSSALGIGKFTLPVIITSILFAFVFKISKLYNFDLKFNFYNLVLVIFFSSIIILADQYCHIRIL